MDLTTLARVRLLIGNDDANETKHDGVLQQLITSISGEVCDALDRDVVTQERTQTFSPLFAQSIFPLRSYPVSSIASVVEASDRDFANGTTIAATDYVVDDSGLLCIDRYAVSPGRGTLRVTYTGGMAATPAEFARAYPQIAGYVDNVVVMAWRGRDALGLQSLSMEGVSASWSGNRLDIASTVREGARSGPLAKHVRMVAIG